MRLQSLNRLSGKCHGAGRESPKQKKASRLANQLNQSRPTFPRKSQAAGLSMAYSGCPSRRFTRTTPVG